MNVLEIIRTSIDRLPDGPHALGLRSVMRHIDAAAGHLARGQDAGDDGAFTDAIYRTNQAFEGSVKEAYRVLTANDPARKTPAEIENYLEKNEVLRERVLVQLRRYRQEWRNPSTHDYNLDFDEDEAFLAIVSVSAFAKVLIDQIAQKLAFDAAADQAPAADHVLKHADSPLSDRLIEAATVVFGPSADGSIDLVKRSEPQLIGALAGYLSSTYGLEVEIEPVIRSGELVARPDMIIGGQDGPTVVELKRYGRRGVSSSADAAQVLSYARAAGIREGILLLFEVGAPAYSVSEHFVGQAATVIVIAPHWPQAALPS